MTNEPFIFAKINRRERKNFTWSWNRPFEVIKTLKSHHGTHALAGWRQGAIQEEITALPSHFQLAWTTDRYRKPRNGANRQWQPRQDYKVIIWKRPAWDKTQDRQGQIFVQRAIKASLNALDYLTKSNMFHMYWQPSIPVRQIHSGTSIKLKGIMNWCF